MSKNNVSIYNLKKAFVNLQKEILKLTEDLQAKKDKLKTMDEIYLESYECQNLILLIEDIDNFIESVKQLEWILTLDKKI